MRRKQIIGGVLAITLAQYGLAAPAGAADMAADLPPAPVLAQEEPVELGSGWYLRGDADFGPEDHPTLFGQGTMAQFSKNHSEIGYGLGVGAGYKLNSFFRFDVTADYLDPYKYKTIGSCGALCSESYKTNLWRWDGLANAYADLGTWSGLTPYIGVGVGFAGTHQDSSISANGNALSGTFVDPATGVVVTGDELASHTKYRLAWAGMAGLSYALNANLTIDLGYRFLDLGKADIPLTPITHVTKEITSNQVRLGMRYMIN